MSPLTLLRSAAAGHRRPGAAPVSRPFSSERGRLRMEASGLPADCTAHFDVIAEDGRIVAAGAVEPEGAAPEPELPEGVYRLRWRPADAVIDGRVHTFVPTVLERRVRVVPGSEDADGSATYVCVRRAS